MGAEPSELSPRWTMPGAMMVVLEVLSPPPLDTPEVRDFHKRCVSDVRVLIDALRDMKQMPFRKGEIYRAAVRKLNFRCVYRDLPRRRFPAGRRPALAPRRIEKLIQEAYGSTPSRPTLRRALEMCISFGFVEKRKAGYRRRPPIPVVGAGVRLEDFPGMRALIELLSSRRIYPPVLRAKYVPRTKFAPSLPLPRPTK